MKRRERNNNQHKRKRRKHSLVDAEDISDVLSPITSRQNISRRILRGNLRHSFSKILFRSSEFFFDFSQRRLCCSLLIGVDRRAMNHSSIHPLRTMTRREQINWLILILLIGFAREWINPTFRNSSLISFSRWNRVSHFIDIRDRTYIRTCSFPSITQLTMAFCNSVSPFTLLLNIGLTFSVCLVV